MTNKSFKTTAIICELNPLHSGHKRLIDYAKTISDKVICIMSGNFTQRGLPACADKYARARHAILAGADLVVELPTIFATASAENFAYGGVRIANQLGADNLLFGSECGDIDELTTCAKRLLDEDTNKLIAEEVKKGVSYPKAVSNALKTEILEKPNNTLGVEYIKALINTKSTIKPITIKREDNFNGTPNEYASSATLRTTPLLRSKFTYDFVSEDIDDCIELKFKSVATSLIALKTVKEMSDIEGVTEGIENRFANSVKSDGYDKMIEAIKTKRYTLLKLQRIALNIILNISKTDLVDAKNIDISIVPLAVSSNALQLLALTEGSFDDATKRADRLYYSLTNTKPPERLQKI